MASKHTSRPPLKKREPVIVEKQLEKKKSPPLKVNGAAKTEPKTKTHDTNRRDIVKMKAPASPNVVAQNYETFMSHLLEDLPPVINERFYQLYSIAWAYVEEQNPDAGEEDLWREGLATFQTLLGEVPNWEITRIRQETQSVIKEMPFLRECLRQMLTARVSILMSVRYDQRTHGTFQFEMPSDEEIVHKIFCRAARRLRGKAKLYNHLCDDVTREENTLEAEDIIRASLAKSIPALVPLAAVVKSHLVNNPEREDDVIDPEPDDSQDDDETEEEDEDVQEEEEDEEDDEEEEEDESSESSSGKTLDIAPDKMPDPEPIPLAVEDVPADKSAASTAVMVGDSEKEVHLKKKASDLELMVENLQRKLSKIPKQQKSVRESIQEEIEYRENQLKRVKQKIKGVDESELKK